MPSAAYQILGTTGVVRRITPEVRTDVLNLLLQRLVVVL